MNSPEKTPPQLAQEESLQAGQETPSMHPERCSMLNEKQLEEVVGAGWPLGLSGVRRAVEQTGGLVTRTSLAPTWAGDDWVRTSEPYLGRSGKFDPTITRVGAGPVTEVKQEAIKAFDDLQKAKLSPLKIKK